MKRLISLVLAISILFSLLYIPAGAANTPEEALGIIDIYSGGYSMNYLAVNGRVQTQEYTYFLTSNNFTGEEKEIPAYCINPDQYGVPQTVGPGESIEYLAEEAASDPKIVGLVANMYPHRDLGELGLENRQQAFYAGKIALWCYLIKSWDISKVTVNPNLTGDERARAERILAAAIDIYTRGMTWASIRKPSITTTPDKAAAYPVTIDDKDYLQQVFTLHSNTWVTNEVVNISFSKPKDVPAGTRIVDMNNKDITTVHVDYTDSSDNFDGKFKILIPVESVAGKSGSVQVTLNADVYKYAVFYAICQEKDKYGNLQTYLADTDPVTAMVASEMAKYDADGTTPPPDNPDNPPPPDTGLEILKLQEGTNKPLAGAIFEVKAPDGTVVGTFNTKEDGKITIPLIIVGNYTITEKVPPENHLLSANNVQNITVKYGEIARATFYNAPYGELRVEKVDAQNGGGLAGARIQIKHIESGAVYTQETGPGGAAQFTDLHPGAYEILELAAPEGWQKDPQVHTTTVVTGETVTYTLKNQALPGLTIVKYDSQTHATMSGVTFEIFRDGVSLGHFETDAMGEIHLTNQQPGTYRIVEVNTGDTGHTVNSTPQEIELTAGEGIKTVYFFNDLKPGMWLVKVDAADPTKVIPNATFSIRAIDGSFGPKEYTTGQDGRIDLSELPTGSYEVVELSCPGYIVDKAQRLIHLEANQTAQFVFTNSVEPSLHLIKLSADGTPLPGVSFRIAKIEDGSHYLDRVTDQNGEILVSGLEPGVYSVVETATKPDHILDAREHHIELFPGKTSTIVLNNDKKPNLVIHKTDATTGEPIQGTTFVVKYADNTTITTVSTDAYGEARVENLDANRAIQVIEQSVPDKYLLDAPPQMITLEPNRTGHLYFQNHPKPAIDLIKTDAKGNFIPGAVFTLSEKNGTVIGDYKVEADGHLRVYGLKPGYYILTEKSVPAPFILDPTPHEVELVEGKTTSITVINHKNPTLTIYKRDSVVGDLIPGARFHIWAAVNGSLDGDLRDLGIHTTDANGQIHLDEQDVGWVRITEIEPAPGYTIKEPATQDIFLHADTDEEITFLNTPLSALVIYKESLPEGTALAGTRFRVRYLGGETSGTGGTVIGEYTTSANGTIVITGLKAGTYIVEEISTDPSHVLSGEPQTVYISGKQQDVVKVTFSNKSAGNLLVRKVDTITKLPLAGVRFLVTDSSGAVIGPDNGEYVTGPDGSFLIPDLKPDMTVVVKEIETIGGYILDDTPKTIQIQSGKTHTLTFSNTPESIVVLRKLSTGENNPPVEGVTFHVTDSAGTPLGPNNGLYRIGMDGTVTITGIKPGTTIIARELRTAPGFVLNPAPQFILVKSGATQELTFYNQPKTGLTLVKVSTEEGNPPIEGVTFQVTDGNGTPIGPNNGQYSSGPDGTVTIPDLTPGTTVRVHEVSTVPGYVLDATEQVITIKEGVANVLTFRNVPLTSLVIRKLSEGEGNPPIQGVTFKVTDASGQPVGNANGEYTTGEDGTVTIPGLTPGTTIKAHEIRTAPGFVLDTTEQTIQLKAGEANTLTFYNTPENSLVIRKLSRGEGNPPIQGVTFKVTDSSGQPIGNANGEYTTGEDGTIVIPGLTPGMTVKAHEIRTAPGFVLDTTEKTIVIKAGKANTLTFWNTPENSLVIRKLSRGEGNPPIPGVTFKVTDSSGQPVGNANGEYVTGGDGTIVIPDLTPGTTIKAHEIRTAPGFVLDTTEQTIQLKAGEANTLTFWNTPENSLVIRKLSRGESSPPISGVTFKVTDASGQPVGNANGEYTTGEDGTVVIPGLTPGTTIKAHEIRTAPGFVLDTTEQTIQLKAGEANALTFYNTPENSLVIRKLSRGEGNPPISGVTFKVTDASGQPVGNANGEYTTGEDGTIVIPNLTPGTTSKAHEIRTAPGFVLDTTEQTIQLKAGEANTLTFYNTPENSLVIRKLSRGEGNPPIEGVTFKVTDSSGQPIGNANGEYVTGGDGTIVIPNLTPGTTIKAHEIRTAPGFVLDTTEQTIQLKAGEANTLTFYNTPENSLVIRKLSRGEGNPPIQGVTFKVTDSSGQPIGNANGEYTTGEDGTVVIPGLTPGTTIKAHELRTAPGFVLDTTEQTIQLKAGEANTLTFYNTPENSLVIRKLSRGEGNSPIPGVTFRVTDASGQPVGNANGEYVTGGDGTIVIPDLTPGTTIKAHEIRTAPGFVLDTTEQTIQLKAGEANMLTFWNTPENSLVIRKLSRGESSPPISGVTFKVTDGTGAPIGNANGEYVTGEDGTITIPSLTPGTTIKAHEIRTAPGFVLDTTEQTIQLKAGEANMLTFWNTPENSLVIRKLSRGEGNPPIQGVTFKVTDSSGQPIGNANGEYTTGEDGTIVIPDLTPGSTIKAHEIRTAPGFVLDTTEQTIQLKAGEANTLTFWNTPENSLVIRKLSRGEGNSPIPGVTFRVTDASGQPVGNANGEYVTGGDGTIVIPGLTPGTTIKAHEIRTAPGFVLDTTEQTIQLKAGEANTLTFYNTPENSLVIRKLSRGEGNPPIQGVTFKVTDASGQPIGNANGEFVTGPDGKITVTGLAIGTTIRVSEIKTVPGFVLDTTEQTIQLKAGEANTLTFYNTPENSLVIRKLSRGEGNPPIQGVTFKVTDSSGQPIGNANGEYVTGEDGIIVIPGLTPGTTIKAHELRTAPGYVLDTTEQTIQLKAGEANTLTFYNTPENSLVIRKLSRGEGNPPISGVTFKVTDASGQPIGNANGEYTTGGDGTVTVYGLTPGTTIKVREIKTAPGFVLDTTEQTIQLKAGAANSLTFYNTPENSLTVRKLSNGSGNPPIPGVTFKVTDSNGRPVGNASGEYVTGPDGTFTVYGLTPGATIRAHEIRTAPGYILDTTEQVIQIRANEINMLTFYNTPKGGLQIIKTDDETGARIKGTELEVRRMNGEIIGTYTTDSQGVIRLPDIENGWYEVTETRASAGYQLDPTPHRIEVKHGETATLKITNRKASSALIHKIDSVTGQGIPGVTFLLYDSNMNPVGQFTSDQNGYVYIDQELQDGKFYLKELEPAPGYLPDTSLKTFYVKYGTTSEITWKNTPVMAQIQVLKRSADDNPINGLPAGTLLEGARFEITDKAGNVIDTIVSDRNGLATSKPLPLGRYTVREIQAPPYYSTEGTPVTVYLEYAGQIVRLEATNKSVNTGVSIQKTGPKEAMGNQPVRYVFSQIANTSTVPLSSFYWRDYLPSAVKLEQVVTGTYNKPLSYKIVYRVNGGEYRTLADSLSTSRNYVLDASPTALGLAANERVSEIMFVFGQVPAGFAQVETPYLYCTALPNLAGGSSFVNMAEVGGVYNGQWIQAVTRWVTTVYGKPDPLPRTGY